jgi:hypothetical protein
MIPGDWRPGTSCTRRLKLSNCHNQKNFLAARQENGEFRVTNQLIMATIRKQGFGDVLPSPAAYLGKIACDYSTLVRFADIFTCWLHAVATGACARGMVVSRAEGF